MCGIAGIFSSSTKVDPEKLQIMGDRLAHRGPDGQGMWVNEVGSVGFMHRRLSIIDLSENGKQPMHYQGRYTITFNGEIYNYIELKKELIENGYAFTSESDTEVLLALYSFLGHACLQKVDGMFAFAIWDDVKKELYLARDRFGEKPLYYSYIDGVFCFASEMKALFAIGASKASSTERVYKYLESNVLSDTDDIESTFYKEVKQIDAGNYAIVRNGKIEKREKYWHLDRIAMQANMDIEEATSEFKRLFTESIKRRMRSDVTVGSSLSGGIDSSSIVLIANGLKRIDQCQNTFSARFANFKKDEGVFIEMVAARSPDIKLHNVWPDADQLVEELKVLCYHQEEPFSSGSIYNQFCVMRLAKQNHTTVLLDGQGADEQLGGYLHYYHHHLTNLFIKKPSHFLRERAAFQKIHKKSHPYQLPKRIPLWMLNSLLFKKGFPYELETKRLLLRDTTETGLKDLLRYGDKNSMAFSREVRLPFLSHELAEFIYSLPIHYLLHKGWTKYILRKAVEDIVPHEITWRKEKIGYEPPQDEWEKKLIPIYTKYKDKTNYLDLTGGKAVKHITDWKWLMLKMFLD